MKRYLNTIAESISKVAASIAGAILIAMMLLTVLDVFLRYINKAMIGAFEVTEFMLVILASFGFAYCAFVKGHVNIELLISRFPQRVQAVFNVIAVVAFLALSVLIVWKMSARAVYEYGVMSASTILHIPLFPCMILEVIGFAALCIILINLFFDYLCKSVKK
jgi:TRAP-type C4-dicarboxylate transport system permease small subunit